MQAECSFTLANHHHLHTYHSHAHWPSLPTRPCLPPVGLEPDKDTILEIACLVTNGDLTMTIEVSRPAAMCQQLQDRRGWGMCALKPKLHQ